MLSLVFIAKGFYFLGRMHVISTGPISTVQTESSRVLHPPRAEKNSSYKL
ncbi:unnamed protein product [Staurois parvus]|uniref:Uncharacterized protein n=1 Tax=Staurois parvus TaxID=386267 RepID=A0ABN9FUW3_9NEOB|nr:unnamed protein product [Staurois parvus]